MVYIMGLPISHTPTMLMTMASMWRPLVGCCSAALHGDASVLCRSLRAAVVMTHAYGVRLVRTARLRTWENA